MLRDAMVGELAKENLLGKQGAPGVVSMNVNIIEYRMGDAFKRWLWPGYGSTILVIEANLLDAEGNVDATAPVFVNEVVASISHATLRFCGFSA